MKIISWNINSVRLRINQATRILREQQPDIFCLQETKCPNDAFPHKPFEKLGYRHIALNGIKGYHGVASISKKPFLHEYAHVFCKKKDGRHMEIAVNYKGAPLHIHNFYVPAGGDEPDIKSNEKFAHKLSFLKEMQRFCTTMKHKTKTHRILLGDLNIAPMEHDVWSHKQLLTVVSHTPIEVAHLLQVQKSHDWIDTMRHFVNENEKLYSWWSYRARDWQATNRGRRLDHIWASPSLKNNLKAMQVLKKIRNWQRPSDHAPVMLKLT